LYSGSRPENQIALKFNQSFEITHIIWSEIAVDSILAEKQDERFAPVHCHHPEGIFVLDYFVDSIPARIESTATRVKT